MLYIFDLDGTLVESWRTEPLSHVPERLDELAAEGHSFAVATNQAGVAWRLWTTDPKFPSASALIRNFTEIAAQLTPLLNAAWFVAVHDVRVKLSEEEYADLVNEMLELNEALDLHVKAEPAWRKPKSGMLLAVCETFDIAPEDTVFVGDMETDAEAAAAIGMPFRDADDFFGRTSRHEG